jgi:hypothetical protein
VICVDEKPAIQALERAQGWLKLPNGKAITGYNHEYKRHGTINLYAALDISTGLIKTNQFQRRRRKEFLQFMNGVIKQYEGLQIHVVLDNLSTHKPKHALQKTSFTSIEQLMEAIEKYCVVYNKNAHPFEWTKQKVFQRTLKDKYVNLCN